SKESLTWKTRYQIGLDISMGVAYLHSQGIIHADLKSLNVLLDVLFRAKISDFGLSKLKLTTSASTVVGPSGNGGSIRWMAPELFTEEVATTTKPSDVYSYGIILWELGARHLPFLNKAPKDIQVPRLLEKGMIEDIATDTPPTMAKLISRCWDRRTDQRPK